MSQNSQTAHEIPVYNAAQIETKWQNVWEQNNSFATDSKKDCPKKYVLEMFPYPSGDLHMGHARNYTIGDVMARQARMRGFDVLHPMGFDAFGLPAENAAIKHHTEPSTWTYANINQAISTMKRMGFSYDYQRMFNTCDPSYYTWGQWMFIKMWEKGLVYRGNSLVNWCPVCKTVLANEQVINGRCWRCDAISQKKKLSQWYFKITSYAQELLDDLDTLTGWPENVISQQRNWIGRSVGTEIDFSVLAACDSDKLVSKETEFITDEQRSSLGELEKLTVFTTRADTIYGVSFLVLPPESEVAAKLVQGTAHEEEFLKLKAATEKISAVDRQGSHREKNGVFTGRYALNPVNNRLVPIWIADYVLSDYGTGAVMGVPCGDQRDFDFAQKYNLEIAPIICSKDDDLYDELCCEKELKVRHVTWNQAMEAQGYLVQSGPFTGMKGGKHSQAEQAITEYLTNKGCARKTVQYRLRDWLISRQRYWGNPIPMIHCDACGDVAVPLKDLPVLLPKHLNLENGQTLADSKEFYETTCPKCGKPARRITDTMDTFTCSSWYFLRYCDPHNTELPFSKEAVERFMPVDNYIGGIEHAILHLLYSRFWTKVMRDLGLCSIDEPFTNLLCQGMVRDEHGDTMSKSKGNVVPPSSVIEPFGADTLRLAILFIAPPEKDFDWDTEVVQGTNRFLKRAWRLAWQFIFAARDAGLSTTIVPNDSALEQANLTHAEQDLVRALHTLGLKCTRDFDKNQFNTAISAVMELVNAASKCYVDQHETLNPHLALRLAHDIVLLLAPVCPHWAEEIYQQAFVDTSKPFDSIYDASWPEFDEARTKQSRIEIVVQIQGKVRGHVEVDADASSEVIQQAALESVAAQLEGKTVKKVIVIPHKLVNIVAC
ncbi:leucine--tRNA ligase [Fannyhessea vaginae]|uniref:leucine--tRNA ligase n=1 Tax=Fannyhessea vaginae TaxID=82135 RepID=UPI0028893337|nr:leucine--tRNA ligase [Fannyhessea vaginae]